MNKQLVEKFIEIYKNTIESNNISILSINIKYLLGNSINIESKL